MGTNFYAHIQMRKRDKEKFSVKLDEMYAALDTGDVNGFSDLLDEFSYDFNNSKDDYVVHLGKRSYGWAFLWDLNNMKYYEPSLYSIMKFIKESGAVIKNEYGDEFTLEQFIDEEVGPTLHPSSRPVTLNELASIPKNQRSYIKEYYIEKGKPYYMYCTSATYNEMNNTNSNTGFSPDTAFMEKCQAYSMYKLRKEDTDFVSYDNLRFALFTNFS